MAYDSFCADIAATYEPVGSLSAAGAPAPLGSIQRVPATSAGFIFGYIVTASGALAGNARFSSAPGYDASTMGSFGLAGDSFEQLWVLVSNDTGGDIGRGVPVKWAALADNTNLASVVPCTGGEEADQVIGVTQFVIPAGKAAYVLAKGVGKAIAGETVGSGARGVALTMDAGAAAVIRTTAGVSMGRLLEDELTDGALTSVFINCRGSL